MALDTAIDMGRDGGGTITARDAYGFQLNYFTGDYKAINTVRNPFPGHSAYIGAAYRPLYNGNISSMGVNIGQLNQPQLYNYEYDQLNRLVSMQAYREFSGNSWSGISATTDHQEAVTYDGNGNIVSYLRNGNTSAGKPLAMDALSYHYNKDGNGNLLNNRLRHVTDGVTATANYTEDIDGQVTDNYHYDQIGNLTRDVSEQIDSIEWNVYGKISRIWKSVNATTGALQQIAYSYDPSGNRISKTVYSNQDASSYKAVHTWYVRDASGNVMATYTSEDVAVKSTLATGTLGKLYLSELHMYGSSRLGIWSRKVDMDVVPTSGGTAPLLGTTGIDTFNRGNKFFELANHLGNVLVTVSDRKVGQNPVNGLYSSYTADVVSASDYAPFGMQMVGRTFSAGSYRYGFNGKENDNEVKGEGNQQDYGMRIYDPRLGKFLSVDPLMPDYPFYSPYQFAGNKPIVAADLDGLEEWMKSQENALKRQAQLQVQKAIQNKATVQPYNPGDRTWVQKWRDSKSFFFQMTYSMANGIYTLPQQLFSGVTQQEYIENMGGGSYRSRGSGSEKQRVENFINGATAFLPSAPSTQAVKGLGLADDVMRLAANGTENSIKATAPEIAAQVAFKSLQELGLKDGMKMSSSKVLEVAQEFLGKGYKEIVNGSGRYVSADGKRVFRMGANDITGAHGGGPHVNFETLIPNQAKPGKMKVDQNYHIYLAD